MDLKILSPPVTNHSERPPMECILTRTSTRIGHNEADYDFLYTSCVRKMSGYLYQPSSIGDIAEMASKINYTRLLLIDTNVLLGCINLNLNHLNLDLSSKPSN